MTSFRTTANDYRATPIYAYTRVEKRARLCLDSTPVDVSFGVTVAEESA
jgi:hypothetical protein